MLWVANYAGNRYLYRALVITSLVLCGGFFIYMTSCLTSNARFGLLAGCGVRFALAGDFLNVPAILALIYRGSAGNMKVQRSP